MATLLKRKKKKFIRREDDISKKKELGAGQFGVAYLVILKVIFNQFHVNSSAPMLSVANHSPLFSC
jgi:hypothetical protein